MTPAEAIQLHETTRAKIKSIHIRVSSWVEPQRRFDTPRQKFKDSELNRMGVRERINERFFPVDNGKGIAPLGKDIKPEAQAGRMGEQLGAVGVKGNVSLDSRPSSDADIHVCRDAHVIMLSVGEKERRRFIGCDPENRGALTRYFGIRSQLLATIDSPAPEWGGKIPFPLLDLVPAQTLARLAEIADFNLSPADDAPYLRLEVKATKRPFFAGFKIDLDPDHGYLIRRTLTGHGGLTEVDEFKPYGEGIWIPNRVRSFHPHDGSQITEELDECEVNGPIADKDLIVEFPEGSQVEDREKKKFYLWGKGGPRQAFDTKIEFERFVRAQWLKSAWSRLGRVFGSRGR